MAPAVLVVEGVPERIERSPPAGRGDVEAPPGLKVASSVGSSSGAHAITPEVYLCSNPRVSAADATRCGSPRSTSTPLRGSPVESRSPRRYLAAARAEPVPRARNLMCIRVRALGGIQGAEHPVDGDQVGDHFDGLDGLLVCIRPPSDLVEVVADARHLLGALALYLGVRHWSRCAPGQPTGAPDSPASSLRSAPWRATRHAPPRWREPSPERRVHRP